MLQVSKSTARGMFVGLICGALLVVLLYAYSPLLMTRELSLNPLPAALLREMRHLLFMPHACRGPGQSGSALCIWNMVSKSSQLTSFAA